MGTKTGVENYTSMLRAPYTMDNGLKIKFAVMVSGDLHRVKSTRASGLTISWKATDATPITTRPNTRASTKTVKGMDMVLIHGPMGPHTEVGGIKEGNMATESSVEMEWRRSMVNGIRVSPSVGLTMRTSTL